MIALHSFFSILTTDPISPVDFVVRTADFSSHW